MAGFDVDVKLERGLVGEGVADLVTSLEAMLDVGL